MTPMKAPTGRGGTSFRLRSSSLNTIRLRRIFDIFDVDGDGEITFQELNRALARLGLEQGADELEAAMASFVELDRSGIGFEDFVTLHRSLGDSFFGPEPPKKGDDEEKAAAAATAEEECDLVEAFHVFDEDGDGFICPRELQSVLGKLGLSDESRDIARVNEMICSVDENNDGLVDFSEFKNMMIGISAPSS